MQPQKQFMENMKGGLSRNLLSSPHTYSLAKQIFVRKNNFDFQAKKALTEMALDQAACSYREKDRVAWTTAYFPTELIYFFDLVPFAPEVAAGASTSFEVAPELLQQAETMGLSSDSCSFHRCAAAGAELDYFPLPQYLMASSHLCDGASRLFQHMAEKYQKPFYFLEVPAINSEEAVNYLAEQLEEICGELEKQTGIKLSEEKIKEVFGYVNEARQFQEETNLVRQKYPDIISGDESLGYVYLYFVGSGHGQTGEVWKTLNRELEERAKNLQGSRSKSRSDKVRLIWLHLRPYHSSELVSYLENDLNVSIAMEEVNFVYWPPLDPEKPFKSIARKIMANPGLGPLDNRLETIVKIVNDYKADGVLHFSHWGCRHSVGGTVMLKKHLRRKGIPFLALDGDYIDGSSFPWGQVRTRVDSFYELIQQ